MGVVKVAESPETSALAGKGTLFERPGIPPRSGMANPFGSAIR